MDDNDWNYLSSQAQEEIIQMRAEIDRLTARAEDAESILALFNEFDGTTTIRISVVMPKTALIEAQYRIGFENNVEVYLPGFASYFPFEEALQRCVAAYKTSQSLASDGFPE